MLTNGVGLNWKPNTSCYLNTYLPSVNINKELRTHRERKREITEVTSGGSGKDNQRGGSSLAGWWGRICVNSFREPSAVS
jgi:hypothetical protein